MTEADAHWRHAACWLQVNMPAFAHCWLLMVNYRQAMNWNVSTELPAFVNLTKRSVARPETRLSPVSGCPSCRG